MVRRAFRLVLLGTAVVACNAVLGIEEHHVASPGANDAGGPDAAISADAVARADAAATVDAVAGDGASLGPPGCFQGVPSTDSDFFNRCTTAQSLRFDNCARVRLCGDPAPALIPPPAESVGATPPAGDPAPPPALGCYDATTRSKLLFMQGSTNFTPFIQAMAPLVAKNGYVIVWQPTSSCAGAGAAGFDNAPGANLLKNPTTAGQSYAAFYDQRGVATPCLLGNSPNAPDAGSETTDVGESDVFANSCTRPEGPPGWIPGSPAYLDVAHYLGPVQALVFVVPAASTQRVISAEAARMVFGMGGNAGVAAPWVDPSHMYIRSATTGTNNILSRAIDVPNDRWWGVDKKNAPATQTALLTASSSAAEQTIGTLSIDYADKVKDGIHTLYFQAKGQLAGFLPDSDANSFDRRNVRDGHYAPWGPLHLYTKMVGGQISAAAAAFIVPFNVPNQALIDATIAGGAVPVCAMQVTRDQEMGPIKAFTPDFSCGCYFEMKVNGGNTCKSCSGPADCPASAPACNLGFCERD